MPSQGKLLKIPFDPAKAAKSPNQYSKETDAAKVTLLETVNYDGISCKVVLLDPKSDQSQVKMWVLEDHGIPAKVEVTEAGVLHMTTEYKRPRAARNLCPAPRRPCQRHGRNDETNTSEALAFAILEKQ